MTGSPDSLGSNAQTQIRSIVERVERLEQEKSEIADQIKDVFAEAKGNGFDVKILRKVIRIRKQDRAKRQEEEAITDLYLSVLGELPLFAERGDAPSNVTIEFGETKIETNTVDMRLAADRLSRKRKSRRAG